MKFDDLMRHKNFAYITTLRAFLSQWSVALNDKTYLTVISRDHIRPISSSKHITPKLLENPEPLVFFYLFDT